MSVDPAAVFAAEGLDPEVWSNGPGYVYPRHDHSYRKVLVCSAGSITFHLEDGDVTLHPGDRLDVPAATAHAATVGSDGVTCWEGHVGRSPGSGSPNVESLR